MSNIKKYYDIDIDLEQLLSESSSIDELFYLKDLKERKLFLNRDINQASVASVAHSILQFNRDDKYIPPEKRTPILLYLVSNGGEVDSGFELIDIIQNSKTPVYTINLGYWYSMGFLIGIAGHKRYATANSKILMHDGSYFVYNSGAKAQDQMKFQRKVEERVKKYILSRSNIAEEEYDSKYSSEWYLYADEAKEKGFIDYIVGEDCDIDEIV